MCGRFRLTRVERLAERFELEEFRETRIVPRFNIAPSQSILTVIREHERRAAVSMRWGFRPTWMRNPRQPPPINARAETIAESRLFRASLTRFRCLIPADGFYEWKAVEGSKSKQPYHIQLADGELFAFAGLWTLGEEGEPGSAAILTTEPNALMATIHHRMPVILPREHEALWLDPTLTDPGALLALLQPFPADLMLAYPVSTLVNSPKNQGAELLLPA